MPRTRSLSDMRGDVRRRADIESASDRHPDSDLTRYINQGIAELYDLLVESRGSAYYRAPTPQTITTTGGSTTRYALNSTFYKLISVRFAGQGQFRLIPFTSDDEPIMREASLSVSEPTHYQIQAVSAGTAWLELLPRHVSGLSIVVDYVPYATELSADGDTFDGINGWEEYAVDWAAKRCAIKDDEQALVRELDADMMLLKQRILKLAPKRDIGKAERVKDSRGGFWGGLPWRWRW